MELAGATAIRETHRRGGVTRSSSPRLLEDLVRRQHGRDAGDEEPHGTVPEEARSGADEEQRGVEPVAEHPGSRPRFSPMWQVTLSSAGRLWS